MRGRGAPPVNYLANLIAAVSAGGAGSLVYAGGVTLGGTAGHEVTELVDQVNPARRFTQPTDANRCPTPAIFNGVLSLAATGTQRYTTDQPKAFWNYLHGPGPLWVFATYYDPTANAGLLWASYLTGAATVGTTYHSNNTPATRFQTRNGTIPGNLDIVRVPDVWTYSSLRLHDGGGTPEIVHRRKSVAELSSDITFAFSSADSAGVMTVFDRSAGGVGFNGYLHMLGWAPKVPSAADLQALYDYNNSIGILP